MRKLYIFRDMFYEDSSGDLIFESLAGIKEYVLEQDIDGLWGTNMDHPARAEVVAWDGLERIEIFNSDYSMVYVAETIEARP